MKQIIRSAMFFAGISLYGQEPTIVFSYDSSGNQKMRELICVSCSAQRPAGDYSKENPISSSDDPELFYYPNPVLEELYVEWINHDNFIVTDLEVFSMAGQLITKIDNLSTTNSANVSFNGLTQGIYNVVLNYSNSERKTLKVVKK